MSEEQIQACIRDKMAQGMTEEEAKVACKPKTEGETKGKTTIPNLTEQISELMKEYGKTLSEQIKHDIKKEMDQVIADTKKEAVEAIRRGIGLDKDPVIHLSEVEGLVRKIVLDNAEPGKRTETVTKEKPTEGPATEKPLIKTAAEIHEELMKKKGTVF